MAESVNGSQGSVQQWGLNDEQTTCEADETEVKVSSRPKKYCKDVTCESTLSVLGPTTLNSTSILPPSLTVGGVTYVPTNVMVVVSAGSPAGPGVPAIPPAYATINVLAAAAATG